MTAILTLIRDDEMDTRDLDITSQILDIVILMLPEYDHGQLFELIERDDRLVHDALAMIDSDQCRALEAWFTKSSEDEHSMVAAQTGMNEDLFVNRLKGGKFAVADQILVQMFAAVNDGRINIKSSIFQLGLDLELIETAIFSDIRSVEALFNRMGEIYKGRDLCGVAARMIALELVEEFD